ncbi:branched-chain amino acid transport system II carrier protein [Lentibacillus cibarius]|uniref:Branched-chain amino acid transport system carrier protein n=1 Tax=Lentibacillus cibarius TaxID=2583219 RepID=A0A549YI23_9BACI|nr:branched-chain amino acid transport system II carrier protein [Lentibacillus cibarius]TRM09244.1 branched-chain amino acid transport system II carrier protein [Lentibacillus cibarius]TRM11526.1 branched-chain amino acid transport system II carrier protein [Lentibacillus cibarius]
MNKLTYKELMFISLMLFSMFFGAGNLIFPAFLGHSAGMEMWVSLSGFIITAVGLPILGVISVGKVGSLNTLCSRVHPWFALVFPILIYLSIGPGLAIPRAGTIAYEMGMSPFLPADLADKPMMLFLYTILFFSIVLGLSLSPSKLVDRFGKLLTPILLTLIFIIFIKAVVTPIGSFKAPNATYDKHSFFQGFLDGYLTMDALAALVFGIVVVNTIRSKGITRSSFISKYMIVAGLGAGALLASIYSILGYLGASSSTIGEAENGAQVLTIVMNALFGQMGTALLGLLFTLACLCVSIGLVISCSQFFSGIFSILSYKAWTVVMTIASLGVANLGLNQILAVSEPILGAIYPIAVVLIILGLLGNIARSVYLSTIVFTGLFSLTETINHIFLRDSLDELLAYIPLYQAGVGWILPALLGCMVGLVISILYKPTTAQNLSYTKDVG